MAPVINNYDQVSFVTIRPAFRSDVTSRVYRTTGPTRAVIGTANYTQQSFGRTGFEIQAVSINNSGDVAYSVHGYSSGDNKFLLSQGVTTTLMGTDGIDSSMSAQSLNRSTTSSRLRKW